MVILEDEERDIRERREEVDAMADMVDGGWLMFENAMRRGCTCRLEYFGG